MGHTKRTIADIVSKELGLPLRLGRKFLDRAFDIIIDDIVYTSRIELRGLGSFTVTTVPPHNITHPITGNPIYIPKKKIVRFKTSITLRRRLNPKRFKAKKEKKKIRKR